MVRFILRRVVIGAITLLVASFLLFAVIRLLPGDEIRAMFGIGLVPEAEYERILRSLDYDRALPVQYGLFMQDLLRGDFGTTMRGTPIGPMIRSGLGTSLRILGGVALLQVLLGPALVWLSVRRPGSRVDTWTTTVTVLLVSVPTLVAAFVLQAVFVYWTDLLPSPVWIQPPDPSAGWRNYVMPILALGLGTAAHLAMVGRVELLATLGRPFVVTARAFGLPPERILRVEALRPTGGRVVQLLAANTAVLLTGLIVVEDVFQAPGLALTLLRAIEDQERILIVTLLMLVLTGVLAVNTLADLVHGLVDPRVREADA